MDTVEFPKLIDLEAVQTACAGRPDVAPYCRLVGRWIWAEFPGKPSEDVRRFLKQTGFRWNTTRSAWQHPCGYHTTRARGYDPREKYGQQPLHWDGERTEAPAPRPSHIERELRQFTTV